METSVKQRLINFIEYKGLSIRKFELTCGLSIGYMKSLRHAPSMDKLSMILSAYPDLNRAWLLTGEGDMIRGDYASNKRVVNADICSRIKEILDKAFNGDITKMAMATYIKKTQITRLISGDEQPDYDVIGKIAEMSSPKISVEWLITGEGEMLDTGGDVKDTCPRVPYTAAAGTLTDAVEGITAGQCERAPRVRNFPAYDFTIVIRGDSMEPEYRSGDEVACRRIDSTTFIQWGKTHVLDTAQGIVMKRVYEDGDKIRCVSYNNAYPDFSIAKSEIYSMNLVVGLLRLT